MNRDSRFDVCYLHTKNTTFDYTNIEIQSFLLHLNRNTTYNYTHTERHFRLEKGVGWGRLTTQDNTRTSLYRMYLSYAHQLCITWARPETCTVVYEASPIPVSVIGRLIYRLPKADTGIKLVNIPQSPPSLLPPCCLLYSSMYTQKFSFYCVTHKTQGQNHSNINFAPSCQLPRSDNTFSGRNSEGTYVKVYFAVNNLFICRKG